jgi:hypothetical protein
MCKINNVVLKNDVDGHGKFAHYLALGYFSIHHNMESTLLASNV